MADNGAIYTRKNNFYLDQHLLNALIKEFCIDQIYILGQILI